MRVHFFAAAAALAAATPAIAELEAPSGAYQLDKNHASITWKLSHQGFSTYKGLFQEFDIDLVLDADDPSQSTLSATIDPASVWVDFTPPEDSEGPHFAEEISNDPRFMNSGEHSEIAFTATGIDVTGDTTGTVTGDLTLLGQTHPVTLDVTLNGSTAAHPMSQLPVVGFSATTTVTRSQWGMDWGVPFGIGDDVAIEIEAEFMLPAE